MSENKRSRTPINDTQDVRDEQQFIFDGYFNTFTKSLRPDGSLGQEQLEKFDKLVTHATGNIIWGNRFDLSYAASYEGSAYFGHGAYFEQNPLVAEDYKSMGQNRKYIEANTVLTTSDGQDFILSTAGIGSIKMTNGLMTVNLYT